MNEKLKGIKEKIEKKGPYREELAAFLQTIEEKATARVAESVEAGMAVKLGELMADIKNMLAGSDVTLKTLTDYLDKQEQEVRERDEQAADMYSEVVTALNKMAKDMIKAMPKPIKNDLSKAQVKQAFSEALEKVYNILLKQNQIPTSGTVAYNQMGKMEKLIEQFDGYSLVTTFQINSEGKLVSWRTVKRND